MGSPSQCVSLVHAVGIFVPNFPNFPNFPIFQFDRQGLPVKTSNHVQSKFTRKVGKFGKFGELGIKYTRVAVNTALVEGSEMLASSLTTQSRMASAPYIPSVIGSRLVTIARSELRSRNSR